MKNRHWLFFDWIYESKLVCTYNVILSFVWRAPSQCTSNKVMLMVNVKGEMIFRMQSHTALYIDLTLYMHALPCTFTVVNHWFTIITDYKLGVELIIMSARNCCVPNHVTDLFTHSINRSTAKTSHAKREYCSQKHPDTYYHLLAKMLSIVTKFYSRTGKLDTSEKNKDMTSTN